MIVVILAILVGLDFYARAATENTVASRVTSDTGAQSTGVSIHSFPFIWDVGVLGQVGGVDVVAHHVPVGPVVLDDVAVEAHNIDLDRGALFNSHQVRIKSISSAQVTVTLHLSDLFATAATRLGLNVGVRGHTLVVSAAGVTLYSVDLTRSPVIPACDFNSTPVASGYVLSCVVAPVPSSVIAALSRA